MSEIRFVGRRSGGIKIPITANIEKSIKLYNQGYGHATSCVVGYLRKHHPEIDEEKLIDHLKKVRVKRTSKIHLTNSF